MASRKEQKERARAERVAKEEAERQQAGRRRRIQIGAVAGAVAIVAVVVVVIVAAGGSGGGDESNGSSLAVHEGSVPADAEVGLQDTPPPWKPDYKDLSGRIEALGLPGFNETIAHTHAWLHIYVDGKKETVPPNIGIDPTTQTISPLHTHDTSGIIHMEADREYDFTLGQFMAIWGVKFSDSQVGSLKSKGDQRLQIYLDGRRVDDPVNVVMPEHGNFVIGYGKPDSFPTEPKLDWPQGL